MDQPIIQQLALRIANDAVTIAAQAAEIEALRGALAAARAEDEKDVADA